MVYIKVVRKSAAIALTAAVFFIIVCSLLLVLSPQEEASPVSQISAEEWEPVVRSLFKVRNECVLSRDFEALKSIYLTDERNGRWAYENELMRSEYLKSWSDKQGVKILGIDSYIKILTSKAVGRGYAFYVMASGEYRYSYLDDTKTVNVFRLGTYHSFDIIPGSVPGTWVISREWYDDPMANNFHTYKGLEEITQHILSASPKDLSDLNERRIAAVEYADMYCGAASDEQTGFSYNKKYTNYNSLGGDCANFASQVLFEGGGFKKNATWNYHNGKGSWAWIKTVGLKDYLIYNSKGSQISRGKYEDVYKHAYELLPGDMVIYARKGKIVHVSVVTGLDSKGCPLVNSHNLDRYRVPWDIGWNQDNITFYLIRVHY